MKSVITLYLVPTDSASKDQVNTISDASLLVKAVQRILNASTLNVNQGIVEEILLEIDASLPMSAELGFTAVKVECARDSDQHMK